MVRRINTGLILLRIKQRLRQGDILLKFSYFALKRFDAFFFGHDFTIAFCATFPVMYAPTVAMTTAEYTPSAIIPKATSPVALNNEAAESRNFRDA